MPPGVSPANVMHQRPPPSQSQGGGFQTLGGSMRGGAAMPNTPSSKRSQESRGPPNALQPKRYEILDVHNYHS